MKYIDFTNPRLSFDELREQALKEGISDNKVSIGLWIKIKGYKRHCTKDINRKSVYYYTK